MWADDHGKLEEIVRSTAADDLRRTLLAFIGAASLCLYEECNKLLKVAWTQGLQTAEYKTLSAVLNPRLAPHEREMTSHGIHRSFRFWSGEEKEMYLRRAVWLMDQIRHTVSENVCLAYGTALAIARSSDLIPHDDDVDLVVVLPKSQFSDFDSAAKRVIPAIQLDGAIISQSAPNLVHVWGSGVKLDIFVGLEERGKVASFPGPRHLIEMSDMFPAAQGEMFGVKVPLPANQEAYLSKVYGMNWRTPDPFFSHNWKRDAYADLF